MVALTLNCTVCFAASAVSDLKQPTVCLSCPSKPETGIRAIRLGNLQKTTLFHYARNGPCSLSGEWPLFTLQEMTPLHYAAGNGQLHVAQFLLHHGANASLKDQDVSFLHFARSGFHTKCILSASSSGNCLAGFCALLNSSNQCHATCSNNHTAAFRIFCSCVVTGCRSDRRLLM